MKTTEYYIKARLFPTILCIVPFVILYYFGFRDRIIAFVVFLEEHKWLGDVSISVAITYLMTQINRFVAKELFERFYFKDEKEMPTTNYLLHSNTFFAQSTKSRIREKIKEKFGIELLSPSQEKENELEARKVIIDAVSQIRNVTRDNSLLLQHNREYGFVRNLIGGCVVAVLVILFNLYFFMNIIANEQAFNISIVVGVLYLIPIFLSKYLVNRYGKNYAKVLFEQFLGA